MQSFSSERSGSCARCCTSEWLRHCIWLLLLAIVTVLLLFRYAGTTKLAEGMCHYSYHLETHQMKFKSVADGNASPLYVWQANSMRWPQHCVIFHQCIRLYHSIDAYINKSQAPSWIYTKNITRPEIHSPEWYRSTKRKKRTKETLKFYNLIYKIEELFHCLSAM